LSLQIAVLGIDLGKNNCSLAALDGSGQIRAAATRAPRKYPQNRIQAEAVYDGDGGLRGSTSPSPSVTRQRIRGAAHVAGTCAYYVKAQKNDDVDAEAIAEAATRPTMRFVELKSAEQLDMQVLHRARDQLVAERTALRVRQEINAQFGREVLGEMV
jgi:transposase